MPTIPIYKQQTSVGGVPNLGRVSSEIMTAGARANQEFIESAKKSIEEKRLEFDNIRAEDAFNKLRERQMNLTLDPEKGYLSRRGVNAIDPDIVKNYEADFLRSSEEIEKELVSERQKQMFRQRAMVSGMEYRNGLMRHVLNESNQYAKQVFDGTIQVEASRSASAYNDQDIVSTSLMRVEASVARQSSREGWAADMSSAALMEARTKIHTGVLDSALSAFDINYASDYLKKNKDQIETSAYFKYSSVIQKAESEVVASTVATSAVRMYIGQLDSDDMSQVLEITKQAESGGRRFGGDGKILTSPKGAQGEMQVMPKTAQSPGYGVKPARDSSPDELARVGADYMGAMIKEFNGDVAMAWAAYNAGPGAVKNALSNSDAEGKPDEWLKYLPKETQVYVTKNIEAYRAGQGRSAIPTLSDIHLTIDQKMKGRSLDEIKLAKDEAERQWNVQEKKIKNQNEVALGEAYRWLEANGGNYAGMPASIKRAIPGEKLGSVRDYAAKIVRGEGVSTDYETYAALKSDKRLLAGSNLLALKPFLENRHFEELLKDQITLRQNGDSISNQLLTDNQTMKLMLTQSGIDPKSESKSSAKKLGQIYDFVQQRIDSRAVGLGRKLNSVEINEEIRNSFRDVSVQGSLFGTNRVPLATAIYEGSKIVVPDSERSKIQSALKAAGQPVTEQRIMSLYMRNLGIE